MADTVKVPGVKKPLNKWLVGGGLAVGGYLIYTWYKNRSSAATPAAAATTTDQYPPDGTTGDPSDPYSTDPATGQTYGDEAVGAGTYGSYGTTGADQGIIGYDAQGNPIYAPGYGPAPGDGTTGGPPFATNDAWANWVISQMTTNDPSLNVGNLTDALGLYLDGAAVSPAQKTLVLDAEAVGGPPPVAGANNYPPNVKVTGSGGPQPGDVAVPNIVGLGLDSADAALKTAGLKYNTDIKNPAKPGDIRRVTAQTPAAGTQVTKGTYVNITWQNQPSTTGGGQVKVPDITGGDVGNADAALKAAGLTYNTSAAPGKTGYTRRVAAQSPKAGAEVARGTYVNITWHFVKN